MLTKEEITQIIADAYDKNGYVQLLHIKLDDINCGKVKISMHIDDTKTNMYGVVHGGALASLSDTALGVTCASVGTKVVTVNYSINFMKNIHRGGNAFSVGSIVRKGGKIIVVKAETFNESGELLTEMLGTMFIIGYYEKIPEKW